MKLLTKKKATSLNKPPSNMFLFLFLNVLIVIVCNKRMKIFTTLGNLLKSSNFLKLIIDHSSLSPHNYLLLFQCIQNMFMRLGQSLRSNPHCVAFCYPPLQFAFFEWPWIC